MEAPILGKSPCGGLMAGCRGLVGGCVALVAIWLCSASAPAVAEACPNAPFRSGPSEHLPDCRAYEQVTPVDKGGQDAVTLAPPFPAQAAACGGGEVCAVAYMNGAAAFAGAPGNDLPNAYLATRGVGGWQTTPLTPPTPQAPTNAKALVTYAFSVDLSSVVLRVPPQQLTENAPAGVYNLYLREPDGSYSLLTSSAPATPPQPGCVKCFEREDVPVFAGASSDLGHVIFEANDSLVADAPAGGVENLYETTAEHVRLVEMLPDNTIPPQGAMAGGGIDVLSQHTGELNHAISQDGSRVLFEAAADGGPPDPAQEGKTELYDRIGGASTIEVSAPGPGAGPSDCETVERVCDAEPAQFWAASADGALVYFTSGAALTKESYSGREGSDLYRYDVNTGMLTDLIASADHTAGPAGASVLGVVGASQDGSYVYFVAAGELEAGAISGQPNLYMWHETAAGAHELRFIATLRAPDPEEEANIEEAVAGPAFPYHSDIADWTSRPTESQAYLTPDGQHLAFMSVEPLTGYRNEDRVTGEADHEVFDYSAASGELVCASCDPSGGRPLGGAFIGAKLTERVSTAFHQPRSLSDDGSRLFFSSPDPLVPGLAGGSTNIFEYEHGTIQLISGMGGGGGDLFLDASASGSDVFFATRERLSTTDTDELVDVYDAHVDGGLPGPLVLSPCQGGACQGPPDAPPSFPSPLSASFAGSANLTPASGGPARTPTQATRRRLLSRALARCEKLKRHSRRAACIAAAKRRYRRMTRP